jgi:hypothetical protein
VDELGEEAFGLVGEAGDEGCRGEVVAEPEPAAFGEDCEGVVDEVVVSSPLCGLGWLLVMVVCSGLAVGEAVGVGAGFDDVAAEGDAVDDARLSQL